jgi:DNA-binding transcriptional ArsR family regulator
MENTCKRLLANVEQINSCRSRLSEVNETISELGQILALSGNEVRLKILFLLHKENELCPCDLSDILQMSIPAVSQHLRKLKDGKIIQPRKEGQTIFYSINKMKLNTITPFFEIINNGSPEKILV